MFTHSYNEGYHEHAMMSFEDCGNSRIWRMSLTHVLC